MDVACHRNLAQEREEAKERNKAEWEEFIAVERFRTKAGPTYRALATPHPSTCQPASSVGDQVATTSEQLHSASGVGGESSSIAPRLVGPARPDDP